MYKSSQIALAGLVFGALAIAPQAWDSASASVSATAFNSVSQAISTVSFPVAAVATATSPNPLTSYVKTGAVTFFFYVKNFGNTDVKGFILGLADSNTNAARLKRCSTAGATFTGVDVCSDGLSPVTLTPGSLTVPLVAGGNINLQISPGKSSTITVDISVNSLLIRNPVITNS